MLVGRRRAGHEPRATRQRHEGDGAIDARGTISADTGSHDTRPTHQPPGPRRATGETDPRAFVASHGGDPRKRGPFVPVVAASLFATADSSARAAENAATGIQGQTPVIVATFSAGSFAESLAAGRDGALYASVTEWATEGPSTGQVRKIDPSGSPTPYGTTLPTGGLLTGLAFDGDGHLFVGDVRFGGLGEPSGVFRVDPAGIPTRVLTLPGASFPNGLAFRARYLYVSDSALGAIWRFRPGDAAAASPATPWVKDPLLAPTKGLGVNGVAFWGSDLYAVNADLGTVVRIPILPGGRAGSPVLVAKDRLLVTADGITFDARGDLWIVTNHPDAPPGNPKLEPVGGRAGDAEWRGTSDRDRPGLARLPDPAALRRDRRDPHHALRPERFVRPALPQSHRAARRQAASYWPRSAPGRVRRTVDPDVVAREIGGPWRWPSTLVE